MVNGKLAILNRRIDPQNDNFTFVSPKGKSVVDYFIVPQDCPHLVKSFEVDVVTDIMCKYNCSNQISPNSKLLDHSMLITENKCNMLEVPQKDANQATVEIARNVMNYLVIQNATFIPKFGNKQLLKQPHDKKP